MRSFFPLWVGGAGQPRDTTSRHESDLGQSVIDLRWLQSDPRWPGVCTDPDRPAWNWPAGCLV